jgi:hypothetical protein
MALPDRLALVTVVFETEVAMLALQARSLDLFFPADAIDSITIIDNSTGGLSARVRGDLATAYGRHSARVAFLRPADLARVPPASGWLVQQVLKLAVADQLTSSHYLVLDAKDHFIRAAAVADFVGSDGLARIPAYSYMTHPLRPQLENVLGYLGIDPTPYLERFSATVTPFTLETAEVRRMMTAIGGRHPGSDFAAEFVEHGLLEFFLYAGWLVLERGSLEEAFDLQDQSSPKVWKGTATLAGVTAAIDAADHDSAAVFSVHRRALPRLPLAALVALADFWTERGLFASRAQALRFCLAFRVQYVVREVRRKLPGRLRALRDRIVRK